MRSSPFARKTKQKDSSGGDGMTVALPVGATTTATVLVCMASRFESASIAPTSSTLRLGRLWRCRFIDHAHQPVSLQMRGALQNRLAELIRRIRSRISALVLGRPERRDALRQ